MKIGDGWSGTYYRKAQAMIFNLCSMMGIWQEYSEFLLVCQLP
jgi:hypothetical protein